MKEDIDTYNEVLAEAVTLTKEAHDIKKDIFTSVNGILRNGFDRAPGEFHLAKNMIKDLDDNDVAEEDKKMIKLLKKYHILKNYFAMMGKSADFEHYDDIASSDIVNVNYPPSVTPKQEKKYNSCYISLFDEAPDLTGPDAYNNKCDVVEKLLTISQKFDKKLDDINEVINVDLVEKLAPTRIDKSTLKAGISLTLKAEKDVEAATDKLHDVTESNLLQNEALGSIDIGES